MVRTLVLSLLTIACASGVAQGHYIWLLGDDKAPAVHVGFSEDGDIGDLSFLADVDLGTLRCLSTHGKLTELSLTEKDSSLVAACPDSQGVFAALGEITFGTLTRGDSTFLLKYWPKTVCGSSQEWSKLPRAAEQRFELLPRVSGNQLIVQAVWEGKPLAGAEVKVRGAAPSMESITDGNGEVSIPFTKDGRYAIRARHVEDASGVHGEEEYSDTRHYSTLTVERSHTSPVSEMAQGPTTFAPLPEAITSFGAAVCDGWLYVYGGHKGQPHRYLKEDQSNAFQRLDLSDAAQWEPLPSGPRLQGLALVSHQGKLYRVGGFTAMNETEEDENLESQSEFARYDPERGVWEDLPPMPTGRSSFDATVMGNHLFVVGGWNMHEGETSWLDSALVVDLAESPLQWQELPKPPFLHRALAVTACNGVVYAIGGMTQNGPTTAVYSFDTNSEVWSEEPDLPDSGELAGFGSAACTINDDVFVTAYDGVLRKLRADRSGWDEVYEMPTGRFFHQMLALDSQNLLVVAGANMSTGSFDDLILVPTQADNRVSTE